MANICVLITMQYPFLSGETFLENEIGYLADSFDEVIILALNVAQASVPTRSLPSNVKSFGLGNPKAKWKYIVFSAYGLLNLSEEEREEFLSVGLKQKAVCLYATGRSNFSLERAKNILKSAIDWRDVSNCVFYSYWFADQALLAVKLARYFNVIGCKKIVSRGHRYDLYSERNSLNFLPYRKLLLREIDLIAPCSDDGTKYLNTKYPGYENKIATFRLGTRDYGVSSSRKENDKIHIVSCSNIIPLKRVDLIAEAVAEVSKSRSVHWTCFGDGVELDRLKSLVERLQLSADTDFKGRVQNTEVFEFYKGNYVDVFINASTSEGLPVSIMEAMSFGIPCVATDVGGSGELVNNADGCLLPVECTPSEIASAVLNVVNRGESVRIKARETWQSLVSCKNYEDWVNVLTDGFENITR